MKKSKMIFFNSEEDFLKVYVDGNVQLEPPIDYISIYIATRKYENSCYHLSWV